VLLRGAGVNPQCTIVVKDLRTGQIRTVCEEGPSLPQISVSPNGLWLASYGNLIRESAKGGATERILKIISTQDGKPRELCRFVDATNGLINPRWSRDGRYIFFTGLRASDEKWDVWHVPVEGGEPRGLGLSLPRIRDISPHPDGFRFAFSSFGPTRHGPEVWVMENFLTQ
jgi:dipeptidyl aminopeptidase/acylaminoacyl peptidase